MAESVEVALRELIRRKSQQRACAQEGVAIVGIAGRFPGAHGPEEIWDLLMNERDAVSFVPPAEERGCEFPRTQEASCESSDSSRIRGGYLRGVDLFDARFFKVSKLEAEQLDPQQRMLMELAIEALDDAGIPFGQLAGSETGVFVGMCHSDYGDMQLGETAQRNLYTNTGSAISIAANRISYFMNLRGPSMVVDTACSSSLVAVNIAEQQLLTNMIDLALVGSSNLLLNDRITEGFRSLFALSPQGACRSFDASADGFVRSEGAAFVVLKRVEDAIRDKDRIYAVIAGSAVNSDGATNGLTAPSQLAQCDVINKALRRSGVSARNVAFVEAHGSGTPLGDAIELGSLDEVFSAGRDEPLWAGSIKSNVGHMEAVAGIGGLIKAALSIHHAILPPSIHFARPNPAMTRPGCKIKIATMPVALDGKGDDIYGGVSSFGLGGTNAHVLLRSYPGKKLNEGNESIGGPSRLVVLSAASDEALSDRIHGVAQYVQKQEGNFDLGRFSNICMVRRNHLACRAAFVVSSQDDLVKALEAFGNGSTNRQSKPGRRPVPGRRRAPTVGVLYTGSWSTSETLRNSWLSTIPPLIDAVVISPSEIDLDVERDSAAWYADAFARTDIVVHLQGDDAGVDYRCGEIGSQPGPFRLFDLTNIGVFNGDLGLQIVQDLYLLGADVPWERIFGRMHYHSGIPRYPWQRRRYWLDSHATSGAMVSDVNE